MLLIAILRRRFTGKGLEGSNWNRVIFTRLGIGNEKKSFEYRTYSFGVNANAAEMCPDHCWMR